VELKERVFAKGFIAVVKIHAFFVQEPNPFNGMFRVQARRERIHEQELVLGVKVDGRSVFSANNLGDIKVVKFYRNDKLVVARLVVHEHF
jgi:hypothetical protein